MGNKRYTIVITEYVMEETLTRREWKQGAGDASTDGFGYTPQIPQQELVKRDIFVQNVDELDIVSVIKAVNKI